MINNLFTFVRTLGNQRIEGKKFFTTQIGVLGTLSDGAGSIGTSGKVLSSTGTGVQWITVGGGTSNVDDLNDLSDVVISSAASGQLLRFNGTSWVNWTPNFLTSYGAVSNHTDVSIASPATGQLLRYNGTNWVNWTHNFLTTSATLASLSNVANSADGPNNGDILIYNSASNSWVADEFPEFTESDTLDSVTDRGNTTTNAITVLRLSTTGTGNSVTTSKLVAPNIEYNGFVTVNSVYQTDQGEPNPVLFKVNWNGDNHFTVNADGYAIATTGFKVTGQTGFLKANGTIDGSTYLTSYTETDTLHSVTSRGNSTTNDITVGTITSGAIIGPSSLTMWSTTGPIRLMADETAGLIPDQGDPANVVFTFDWMEDPIAYIDTDGKITSNGFKTPAGTSSGFLKADGSIDTTQYLTSVPQIGIDDLTDVTITNPSEGDLLRYDDTSGEWVEWTPNYLTTETDPTVPSHVKSITAADISNWDAAYNDTVRAISFEPGDGNLIIDQNDQGTLSVSLDGRYLTEEEDPVFSASAAAGIDEAAISKWSTAYDWGNHADAGYLTTESQTLNDVTTLGNTTTNTIGVGGVTTPYVQFESVLAPPTAHMSVNWGDDHNALEVYYQEEKHFDVGQDQMWYVKNGHETALAKGTVVMAIGAVGNSGKIEVGPLDASGAVSGKYAIGIMMDDVDTGEFGFAMTQGKLRGIDTSELTEGAVLYADPVIPGALTKFEPASPALKLPIAFVVNASNNGTIAVRMTQGLDLHEVHDVNITNPQELDMLVYDSFNGYWYNSAIPFITEETDPIFEASAAFGITEVQIGKWSDAYDWGNHADAGYLTSYTETDPIFTASAAYGITATNISNWNTAYGWGDHATVGYLTSFTETDPTVPTHVKSITEQQVIDWDKAYGWGNHADYGYLTSYTETDPTVPAHVKSITTTNISNWNSAYGWGNHANAGYLTEETDPIFEASPAFSITEVAIGKWNTAYDWGNHADAGYLTSASDSQTLEWDSVSKNLTITNGNTVTLDGLLTSEDLAAYGYITGESDTLATVTARGATTNGNIVINGEATIQNNGYLRLIAGSSQISGFTVFNAAQNGYLSNRITTSDHARGWGWEFTTNEANNDAGSVYFRVGYDGAVSYLNSGNFGIGTTSPSNKLTVHQGGGVRVTGIASGSYIELSGDLPGYGSNSYPVIKSAGTIHFANNSKYSAFLEGNNTYFGILDSTIITRVFLNTAGNSYLTGGNLGIGTTAPQHGLHINLNQNQVAGFQSPNPNTWIDLISTAGTWSMGATASNTWAIYERGGANATRFEVSSSAAFISGEKVATQSWVDGQGYLTSLPAHTHTIANVTGLQTALDGKLTTNSDSEQVVGLNQANWNAGEKWMRCDPRWNESGYDAALGTLHIYSSTQTGESYGRAGIALWNDGAYQYLTTKSGTTGLFVNNNEIIHAGNIGSQSVAYATSAGSASTAATVTGKSSISYVAHSAGANDYNLELYSDDTGDATKYVSLRFHQGSRYWGQIRYNNAGFRLTGGADDSLNNIYAGIYYATGGNSTNWNTAYSWGDHSTANYFKLSGTEPITIEAETVTFTGSVTIEGTLTESSSIRFKENIKTLEPALSKVEQLNPVTYNKIGVAEEEIGLIAEEVAELFPEVVTYNEEGHPQGIQYQRLSVILLKAVQELTERVNKLENK